MGLPIFEFIMATHTCYEVYEDVEAEEYVDHPVDDLEPAWFVPLEGSLEG